MALPGGHWANIDTGLPNRVVAEGLAAGAVPGLAHDRLRAEVAYGTGSRVDFQLLRAGHPDCLLEVKSVTLRRGNMGAFPDCVTARGTRHLRDLAAAVGQGKRAVMLFLLGRTDCDGVCIAGDIDPAYARAFHDARDAGVEMMAHRSRITPQGIEFGPPVAVDPHSPA